MEGIGLKKVSHQGEQEKARRILMIRSLIRGEKEKVPRDVSTKSPRDLRIIENRAKNAGGKRDYTIVEMEREVTGG